MEEIFQVACRFLKATFKPAGSRTEAKYFSFYIYLFAAGVAELGACMQWLMCEGQRTTQKRGFFYSNMQVLGVKLRASGLLASTTTDPLSLVPGIVF